MWATEQHPQQDMLLLYIVANNSLSLCRRIHLHAHVMYHSSINLIKIVFHMHGFKYNFAVIKFVVA